MKALGMKYPIVSGQQGYFEQTYESMENEKTKLKNLMNTIEGERYMQPSFGLSLHKYLFEPITAIIQSKIETDVKRKIEFWLPNLIINDLLVDIVTDVDRNRINVSIDFSLKSIPSEYDVVTFTFDSQQLT